MRHSLPKRTLASLLLIGTLGVVSSLGIFGGFGTTTQNSGNQVTAGNVSIGNDASGQADIYMTNAKPGDSQTSCVKITYTGSINAIVHVYADTAALGSLAPYVDLVVKQGTQPTSSFPSCSGFISFDNDLAPTGVVFAGTVSQIPFIHDYATGVPLAPGPSALGWTEGQSIVLEVTATLDSATPSSLQSATTGPFTLIAEAHDILNG